MAKVNEFEDSKRKARAIQGNPHKAMRDFSAETTAAVEGHNMFKGGKRILARLSFRREREFISTKLAPKEC